ncbi:MAG: hypothetical protein V5A72_01615 [Candidatus Nanohaloarchaea archaeon]
MTNGRIGGVTGNEGDNEEYLEPIPGGENEGSGGPDRSETDSKDDDSSWWPPWPFDSGEDDGSDKGDSPKPGIPGSTGGPDLPGTQTSRRGFLGLLAAGAALDYSNIVPGDKNAGDGYGRIGDCGGDFDAFGVYGEQEQCPRGEGLVLTQRLNEYDVQLEGEDAIDAVQWYASVDEGQPAEVRTEVDMSKLGETYLEQIEEGSEYTLAFADLEEGGGVVQLLEDGDVEEYTEVDEGSYETLKDNAQEYLEINS